MVFPFGLIEFNIPQPLSFLKLSFFRLLNGYGNFLSSTVPPSYVELTPVCLTEANPGRTAFAVTIFLQDYPVPLKTFPPL